MTADVYAYADGGLCTNPRAGGTGVVLVAGGEIVGRASGHHPGEVTNQQMEIEAAILALGAARGLAGPGARLVVRSDSAYLVNCLRQKWWMRWMRNGWRNNAGEPVANVGHWRRLLSAWAGTHHDLYDARGPSPWRGLPEEADARVVRESLERGVAAAFEKVKGHSGEAFNEEADRLAAAGARNQPAGPAAGG